MQYTEKERVLLINLYEVRKIFDKENTEFYDEEIEILRNGYEIFYSSGVYEPMPIEDSKEVLDILHMYIDFEDAYSRADEELDHVFAAFPGFSGNYEGGQLRFARFLIEQQRKFPQLTKYVKKLNSPFPLLPLYRLMLDIWKKYPSDYRTHQLTNDSVLNIIEQAEKAWKR